MFAGYGRKRFEFMRLEGESKEHLLDEETAWELLASWGFKKVRGRFERADNRTTATWNAGLSTLSGRDGRSSSPRTASYWPEMRCTSCPLSWAKG